MKHATILILALAVSFCFGFSFTTILGKHSKKEQVKPVNKPTMKAEENIQLGVFSMSLSVKNLETSKQFYEKIGFKVFAGNMNQNYLIMKNGNTLIGLFQGMFKGNMLTFNPGWDENAANVDPFDDIRKVQHHAKTNGIKMDTEADESTAGPASFMITDPDGNVILFDQHR